MLSKQLQDQIEQEGKAQQKGFESKLLATVADSEYCIGAEKYATLYETAIARAERAEQALRDIKELAVFPKTENESGVAIYNIRKICVAALTPKTGEDENA